jgi:HEAT repeat protein
MKRSLLVAITLALVVTLATTALAGADKTSSKPAFNMELAEANLIMGVQSDNLGLRTSAAQMLGDFRSKKAVFALMGMLKNDTDERGRIAAALALYKIGNPVGIYAVKQTARLDDSGRVRKLCTLFYEDFQINKKS